MTHGDINSQPVRSSVAIVESGFIRRSIQTPIPIARTIPIRNTLTIHIHGMDG